MTWQEYFDEYYMIVAGAAEVSLTEFIERYTGLIKSYNQSECQATVMSIVAKHDLKVQSIDEVETIIGIKFIDNKSRHRINNQLKIFIENEQKLFESRMNKYKDLLKEAEICNQMKCTCDQEDYDCDKCKKNKKINNGIANLFKQVNYSYLKETLGKAFGDINSVDAVAELMKQYPDNKFLVAAGKAYIYILES
jgi:hypothetical protein